MQRIVPRILPFVIGVALLTISTGAGRIFIVLGGILAARSLGSSEFGVFAYIQSTTALVGAVLTAGLSITVTRFAAELRASAPKSMPRFYRLMLGSTTTLAVLLSALLCVFAASLSTFLFGTEDATLALRIAAIGISTTGATACSTGILTAAGFIKPMAQITGAVAVVTLPLLWILVTLAGIEGACAGVALFTLLEGCALVAFCLHRFPRSADRFEPALRLPSLRRILSFAFPSILSASIGAPTIWFANWTLSHSSAGSSAIGAFNAALQCFAIISFVPAAALRILLPWFTERIASGKSDESYRVAAALTVAQLLFGALVFALAAPLSDNIAGIYGDEFILQSNAFLYLFAAAPVAAAGGVLGTWLNSSGRHWLGLSVSVGWSLCFAGCLQTWPNPDAQDAALAMLVAYAIQVVLLSLIMTTSNRRRMRPI